MFDLTDRVVLVTGASRGIGRAIALELARAGASVAVHFRTEARAAEGVAEAVRRLGRDARTFRADVRERAEIGPMVRSAGEWHGRLDGLVTSAGIFRGPRLEEVDAREWEEMLRTDLEGTFRTVQAAVPWLKGSPHAAIVTLSSVFGHHPGAGATPYQIAKAGVEQMTRALALELAPTVRVNAVAPGYIRTDMNRAGHEDPAFFEKIVRRTPLRRWGEAEDVAPLVRYLLSSEAAWVTGTVIGVDGGIALR